MIDNDIIDYLIENETYFLPVLDKFNNDYSKKPDCLDFKIFYENNKIDSLIAYTDYGTFYPHVKPKYLNETIYFINNSNLLLFSIYGEISQIKEILNNLDYKSKNYIEYYSMLLLKENFQEFSNYNRNILCRKCDKRDFNNLKKLQYLYHKEEVYTNGVYYPYEAEMESFKQLLETRLNYAIFNEKNRAVSKVNVNGESPNYFQIGGMFTMKEYRNKGYARLCLNALSKEGVNNFDKNGIILFVKKDNYPAIKAYEKLGFKVVKETAICYF